MTEILRERIHLELNAEITAKINVLVEEGLYSTNQAFVEQAIENQIALHQATFDKYEKAKSFVIGLVNYSAKDLEKIIAQNKRLEIKVIGAVIFGNDVTPELIDRAVAKINLAGILRAPESILPKINERRYSLLGRPYTTFKELNSGDEPKKLSE